MRPRCKRAAAVRPRAAGGRDGGDDDAVGGGRDQAGPGGPAGPRQPRQDQVSPRPHRLAPLRYKREHGRYQAKWERAEERLPVQQNRVKIGLKVFFSLDISP